MSDGRAKTNDECFWDADCMNALIMYRSGLMGLACCKKLEEGAPDHFVRSPEALLDLLN